MSPVIRLISVRAVVSVSCNVTIKTSQMIYCGEDEMQTQQKLTTAAEFSIRNRVLSICLCVCACSHPGK